ARDVRRPAEGRLPDPDHRPVPAPIRRAPADVTLLHADGVRRAEGARAVARFRPRRIGPARPQQLSRARADRGVRAEPGDWLIGSHTSPTTSSTANAVRAFARTAGRSRVRSARPSAMRRTGAG